MNREEMKMMFLQMDCSNLPEKRQITVTMDKYPSRKGQGIVEILKDGPDGYSTFSTHQENPFLYVSEREEYISGEYELIIK